MHTNSHRNCPACSTALEQAGARWKMISGRYQVENYFWNVPGADLHCPAAHSPARTQDWPKCSFRNKMLLQMEELRLGLNFDSQNNI